MSDEPDRQDLENRIDELEQTVAKMLPSRRDALKLGGAALVGGAAMSGAASAQPGDQDGEAGVIGTDNSPVDIEASDIEVDDLVVNDTVTTDTMNAQDIDAVSVNTDNLDIGGSLSGGGIQKYESGFSLGSGTNLTVDTGIATDFNGALLTANFKRDASGALDQFLFFVYGNDSRSPTLISNTNESSGVSNVDVDSSGSTYVVVFDASNDIFIVKGVGIGPNL